MLATLVLASGLAYFPPGAFDHVWTTADSLAFLAIHESGFGVTIYPREGAEPREIECVFTDQIPGVYQYSATCDDGADYVLTLRDPVGNGHIFDAEMEFDGLKFSYGDNL